MLNRFTVLLVCVLVGSVSMGGSDATDWSSLPANAVVVSINGKDVTKDEFTAQANLWSVLFSCRGNNMSDAAARAAAEKNRQNIVDSYIFLKMVNSVTNIVNLVVTPAQRKSMENRYVQNFTKGPKHTFADLVAVIKSKGVENEFVDRFDADLRYEAYFNGMYSNEYNVTELDVDRQIEYLKRYNVNAANTNAYFSALGRKLIAEAKGGADFAELAKQWSFADDKKDGGDLGECFSDDFVAEKSEYWGAVSVLKPGEVSELLETDEGYEIVKNIGKTGYTTTDGIHLARIFLRRAMILPILPRDELKEELADARRERARKKFQLEIRRQSSLKFPYTKKIFDSWKIKE